jgi:hypothetical protein
MNKIGSDKNEIRKVRSHLGKNKIILKRLETESAEYGKL